MGDQRVQDTDTVRDLGIILDKRWTFNAHLGYLLPKSFKTLGFIKRLTFNFSSLAVITYLFKTLVLPGLTYASVIWSPQTQEKFTDLNRVLTRFLRFASYKYGKPLAYDDHDYSCISAACDINKLDSIHLYQDICFVVECLKGNIKYATFDRRFVLRNLTYCLRNHRPFLEHTHSSNYISHLPSYRLVGRWNTLDSILRTRLLEVEDRGTLRTFCLKHF